MSAADGAGIETGARMVHPCRIPACQQGNPHGFEERGADLYMFDLAPRTVQPAGVVLRQTPLPGPIAVLALSSSAPFSADETIRFPAHASRAPTASSGHFTR